MRYCPGCGQANVHVATSDSTLWEVLPEVRRHVCGLGGPGSRPILTATVDTETPSDRGVGL